LTGTYNNHLPTNSNPLEKSMQTGQWVALEVSIKRQCKVLRTENKAQNQTWSIIYKAGLGITGEKTDGN
jgi:hypothetical protein